MSNQMGNTVTIIGDRKFSLSSAIPYALHSGIHCRYTYRSFWISQIRLTRRFLKVFEEFDLEEHPIHVYDRDGKIETVVLLSPDAYADDIKTWICNPQRSLRR